MKKTKSLPLRTASCKFVSFEEFVLLFYGMSSLQVIAWFGKVENLSVHFLLSTCFIDRCIRGIILSEQGAIPWNSQPLAIKLMQKASNALAAETKVIDLQTVHALCSSVEEEYLCCVARQVTILAYLHAALFVTCSDAGFMTTETLWNITDAEVSWLHEA